MRNRLVLLPFMLMLVTLPAAAQEAPGLGTIAPTPRAHFILMDKPGDWLASRLIGSAVYGMDNQKLGELVDVVNDYRGATRAYVLHLDARNENVAIAPSALVRRFADGVWTYQLDVSPEILARAPHFRIAYAAGVEDPNPPLDASPPTGPLVVEPPK